MDACFKWTAVAIASTVFVGSISVASAAHHSASMYDQTREVTVRGVVQRVDWANPHVYFHVEGVTAEGDEVTWAVEAGPRT